MMGCGQRTGFLTLTFCGGPVVAACLRCGKPICAAHLVTEPTGPSCPDCAVMGLDADEASSRGLDASYYRRSADDADTSTYDPSDYETFEGKGGEAGGGGASGDWGDGDEDSDAGDAADFQDS